MCKAKYGWTAQLQGGKTKQQSLGLAINKMENAKMPRCRRASTSIEISDTSKCMYFLCRTRGPRDLSSWAALAVADDVGPDLDLLNNSQNLHSKFCKDTGETSSCSGWYGWDCCPSRCPHSALSASQQLRLFRYTYSVRSVDPKDSYATAAAWRTCENRPDSRSRLTRW